MKDLLKLLPLVHMLFKYSCNIWRSNKLPGNHEESEVEACSMLSNSHLLKICTSNAIDVSVYKKLDKLNNQ